MIKRFITIPLLVVSLILSGANHYIKNGGSDAASGADDANAWETITKVNSHTYVAGDSILFKKGDTFIGTITPGQSGSVGNFIVYGAYGTGNDPIITPNDYVVGITWAVHSGDVWETTDIGYNPGNILVGGIRKIHRINDYYFTHSNSFYGGTSLQLLAKTATDSLVSRYAYVKINFWDGLDALYCYDTGTGTTYLRFRGGEDPNDSTFYISAASSKAVYIAGKSYVKIRDLHIIGGDYGIYILGYSSPQSLYNVIDDCYIESSNKKIQLQGATHNTTISSNYITNDYYAKYQSGFEPGAWERTTSYENGVQDNLYYFTKTCEDLTESGSADGAIRMTGGYQNSTIINDNTAIGCVSGINIDGTNCEVYNNTVSNCSSIGIMLGYYCDGSEVYDNYISDTNLPFRFGEVNSTVTAARTFYIYRNRIYNPEAGMAGYIHYNSSVNPSITDIYFYHNSYILKTGMDIPIEARDDVGGSGAIFINNIFSVSGYNTAPYSWVATDVNLFIWYYNWVGGTYYGAGALPGKVALWATDVSNLNNVNPPEMFWNHATDPPTYAIEGTEAIDAGIDISQAFVLGGTNYSALPGFAIGYEYGTAPDLGYYEYEGGVPPSIPLVSTIGITGIHLKGATGNGDITYAGEGTISDCGICWSTSVDPDLTDSHVHSGCVGLGTFTGTITGLARNTTYHVRAFAINETGTGYGADVTFTTPKYAVVFHNGKICFINGKVAVIY